MASLVHDPELLILDEPFQGLDPVNVKLLKGLIRELRGKGKTVVLSAHQMNLEEFIIVVEEKESARSRKSVATHPVAAGSRAFTGA